MIVLTARQLDVLKLAADGYSRQMSADVLGLSAETVKQYRSQVLQALRAADMAHAVGSAYKAGILRVDVVEAV